MLRRALVVVLVLIVLLGVAVTVGLWYLPGLVQRTAIWRLQAATGRTVTIEALDISLTSGRFSIRGFRIADRETGPPLAEFEKLEGRFHRRSLLRGHVWIESLALTGAHARIVRLGPNRYNISDVLPQGPSSGGGVDVSIDHLTIAGGWIELVDRVLKPARTWRSDDIRLDARNLSTLDRKGTAIGFTTVAGALVNLRIEELQLAPVHLRAFLNVRDLDLALAAVYLPGDAPLKIEQGVLDAAHTIVHDARDGVTLDVDGVVQKAVLRRPGVPGDAVTAPLLRFMVRELHQRPEAIVLRYASVGGDVTVLDPTTTTPRKLVFTDFTATASGLETAKGRAQLAVHANVPGGGEVDIGGTASLLPRRAELRVRARAIELATIGRYLPFEARLDGIATADVKVTASQDGAALGLNVAGDTTLERVSVGEDARTLVSAAQIKAGGVDYTWPATIRIADLAVTRPVATVERDAAGEINLAMLLRTRVPSAIDAETPTTAVQTPSPARAAPSTPPIVDVQVARLRVDDGRATLTDAASGGRTEITRLALTAGDAAWPLRGTSPLELSAVVAGGDITVRGTLDGALRRLETTLRIRSADLATLQPWLPIVGQVRGSADADITTVVTLDPFALTLRGALGVSTLAFLAADRPQITVVRVEATGVDAQWPTKLAIDRLRVTEPWARIERDPTGKLSLRAMFARRPDRPAPTGGEAVPAAPGMIPGLQVSVRELSFDNGGTSIVDTSVEPAARFEVRGTNLVLRNLTWPATAPAAVRLSTPMPGGGTVKARGQFSIQPTRLALEAEIDQVDLGPARPYVPFDARVRGKVSGRVKVNGTFGDTISLVVEGDTAADRLALGDDNRRLATVQRAEMTGFRYQYPTSIRIRQIVLRKPWLLVERNTDGSFALASLVVSRTAPTPAAAVGGVSSAPVAPIRVLVGTLTMEDGFVRFVDRTTNPDFAEELSAISVTAEGLGTLPSRNAKVALKGTFASGTPLAIHGEVGGFTGPRLLDLTVDIADYPVPRLSPYMDLLLGWVAKNGTLTATMHYRLTGDNLQADNDVTLRALDLERAGAGGAVQQRVGLPLDTLVDVLKDRKGDVHVNVPVGGSLAAPEFHYGEAVWAALRNMAIRLVALPFSLIGKLFFTEDSRIASVAIDPVIFQTARAEPTPPGAEQLTKLAIFLRDSSGVRLRLRPVTTVADVTSLRREALDARLAQAGSDATARRQAAVGLYAELFPLRQPPTSDDALMDALAKETPPPPRALRALATDRVATTRDSLVRAGIAPERLEPLESRAAVENEGSGRVEFEIAR